MEKVVYLHTTKKTAEVFREFAREDVHVVELEHAEDLRDFLAWADLAILHAPSLREKLLPVIHQIFSCEKSLFVAVLVEEMKPDFSQDLIALGVRDVIDCGAPLPVIRQRIRNLLDLLKAEKNDERWSPEQAGESIHLTSVIEALKNVPGLSQALKRAEDPIASFLHFSSSLLGVTRLCLLGEKENRLKVISSLGLPEKLAEEISFSLAEGAAYYLKNEFCILRKDIPSDSPSWKQAVEEMKSMNMEVLVPVMDRGRLTGALGVSRKMSGRKFTEGDMALLVYLARLVPEL
ncbi:MAG: GAF domain-containing protein, partial [Candidatus Aureabacteria bacterium]|nr:GAF domain-containing protein [Candidatus Auribacterota bacterium]